MAITDVSILQRYIRMCNDGWLQGWHERNGGNLTYRLTDAEVAELQPYFDETPRPWVPMGVTGANLAGSYFLSTGSGKYFRNVILDPADSLCVVEINEKGDSYRIVWGLVNGGRPTSEFPSHFMNHSVRVKATGGACRVIYHAHPGNLIAMTYVLPLTDRDFSRELWKSATECPVVFPGGVGVVGWMVPGGAENALATSKNAGAKASRSRQAASAVTLAANRKGGAQRSAALSISIIDAEHRAGNAIIPDSPARA